MALGPWIVPIGANGALITDGLFSEHDGDRMVEVVAAAQFRGAVEALRQIAEPSAGDCASAAHIARDALRTMNVPLRSEKAMALDLDNLHCAFATCTRPVTHVCIQTDQWNMLFKSAAGLVCERHAEELGTLNGLSMPLEEFAKVMAHG